MTAHLNVKDLPEDVQAILDAAPKKRDYVIDAIRRVHTLDLTDETAYQLRALRGSSVEEPLATAARLLQTCEQEAMGAAQYLQLGAGWRGGEVLAVMQTLMGTLMTHGFGLGPALAMEMSDAARLGSVDLEGWGVTPERWAELVAHVQADSEIARALLDVGRLFWATPGGSALERALRRQQGGSSSE